MDDLPLIVEIDILQVTRNFRSLNKLVWLVSQYHTY